MPPVIGVLALQGAFREHARMLRSLGAAVREVRLPSHLEGLDGLVIPGGESTSIGRLMTAYRLLGPLREFALARPVMATCAGLIVLAERLNGGGRQPLLEILDVVVERNGYGRQVDSFEAPVDLLPPVVEGADPFMGVFIRAPRIVSVGPRTRVIATVPDDEPVGVLEGHILALTFHPELTSDSRLHEFFLSLLETGGSACDLPELTLMEV